MARMKDGKAQALQTSNERLSLVEGEDYYVEGGLVVMTAAYHKKRGYCCGNGCKWCPFEPKHQAGATTIMATKFI